MSSLKAKDSNVIQHQSPTCYPISSPSNPPFAKHGTRPPDDAIIPDSEEERINEEGAHSHEPTIIVVSSDPDSDSKSGVPPKRCRQLSRSSDPFIKESTNSPDSGTARRKPPINKGKGRAPIPVRPIEHDNDSDVICISDTDTDTENPSPSASPVKKGIIRRTLTPYAPILDPFDLDLNSDDSAILTFDPHVRARPVPRTPSNKVNTPSRSLVPASAAPSTSKSPTKPKKVSPEQLRLQNYAQGLFDELNTAVFEAGLAETELVWNVRLLTTAGRAVRRKQGMALKLKIELSTKVVDSEERVRNTLAHEMCHIAVWILDGNPREDSHGRHFKLWAARVTKARPDITISKVHSYEINYKFRWECLACGKIFGRHSNSINTEKSVCGVHNCHGQLKPLFERPARRTTKFASGSKLASGSPRDLPRSLYRPSRSPTKPNTTGSVYIDLTNEDDLDDLIKGLGYVSIQGEK